ncbi:primosomal protein N' [Bacillota bacterium Meth-B3]|nr:primosomal protein N' [Christensenellaceae bacterium]
MTYAHVVIDLSVSEVDRPYTYSVPEGMRLSPGQRVLAPFGGRRLEGFVVDLLGEPDVDTARVKPIVRALEDYPLILPELMELAAWMRERYRCTLAAALRLMIPAQLRGERVAEKTRNAARLLVAGEALDEARRARARAPRQLAVMELLEGGPQYVAYLNTRVDGAHRVVRALESAGLVEVTTVTERRNPFSQPPSRSARDPELTNAQRDAARRVTGAMDDGGGRFLLAGVTGSGKTEVYIALIRHALKQNKGAIVLVPEIALTPQMTDWFRARFGECAAVLHSRLSPGERYDEWRRIRDGEARVVVGARSAVFAPVERLGLIAVDEEHEHTYQSEKRPRYDAREVARYRCEQAGGALVLGSATPQIASYMRAMPGVRPENRYQLLELGERVNGRPMPEVTLVDMCRELEKGNHSIFSAALQQAMDSVLARGEQAMLMLNRRGYATFVSCRACGYVEKCDACDVSMTYHQAEGLLKCHYCGAVRNPPAKCPACASPYIKFFGVGTQRVEDEVAKRWPKARLSRMDMDTTRAKDAHAKILSAFRRGETDILIGTQMIAKGLDFPNVTLVGVIAADLTLNLPDYRSAERTFQLITQAAGRAGRADRPGQVVVQSYDVDHYAIELAAKADYRAFYHREVSMRKRALYPPFTVMARLLVTSREPERARRAAEAFEVQLNEFLDKYQLRDSVITMRALEAPIAKLRGESRWQLFIKLYARGRVDEVLSEMDAYTYVPIEGVIAQLEINPANMF